MAFGATVACEIVVPELFAKSESGEISERYPVIVAHAAPLGCYHTFAAGKRTPVSYTHLRAHETRRHL
eukprot:283619-Prorocentrum_lima.AAC.1